MRTMNQEKVERLADFINQYARDTEIREEETELPYTKDMAVEEICARMTVEEAGALIVPIGSCKGWTLAQVADRRPISLKWYISGYNGDDNILRAGATIMQLIVENKVA